MEKGCTFLLIYSILSSFLLPIHPTISSVASALKGNEGSVRQSHHQNISFLCKGLYSKMKHEL